MPLLFCKIKVMNNKIILGVAGTFASGQDSLCKYLAEQHNFLFVSTSDMVRQEAMRRYDSIERPVLFQTATELRNEQGGGVLALLALKQFLQTGDTYNGVAIAGIRSLGEMKAIKREQGTMIFTDAPVHIRYERMKSRNRDAETHLTLEQFKEREAKESSTGSSDADFNREIIRQEADFILYNDESYEDFIRKIEDLYQKLSQ